MLRDLAAAGELVAAKRFDEAEGEILRALSGAPKNVQALNLLALVRYKLGRSRTRTRRTARSPGRRRRTRTRAATWV